jgi:NADH-quinone oxidoreductase subunit M
MLAAAFLPILITIVLVCLINFNLFVNQNVKDRLSQTVVILCAGVVFLVSMYIFCSFNSNNIQPQRGCVLNFNFTYYNFYISLGLDGLSVLFFLLSSLLTFLCVIFLAGTHGLTSKTGIILLTINLFLLILFSAKDILLFYLCFEAILIPMFILIGVWGSREKKVRANILFFFYTFLGSLLMLIALTYIRGSCGSFAFDYIGSYEFSALEEKYLWLAFFFGFSSKIPMFPFHIWLPEAHVEAPTVGSVILAGILLKMGVYGFIKVHLSLFLAASMFFSPLVFVLCIIGVVVSSCCAIIQNDLKRLIAYSSVAHMNLLTMGVFCGFEVGLTGALLQCVSHAFTSSGLFFMIGVLYERYHTRVAFYYSGLNAVMPVFSVLFNIFTLANIALPGSSGFISEVMIFSGIYLASPISCLVGATSIFLCSAYSLWLNNKILYGNIKINNVVEYKDVNNCEAFVLISLVLLIIFVGVNSEYCLDYILPVSERIGFY